MSGPSARLVQFLGCCLHRRRTPRLGRRRRWHDSRDGGRRHAWTPQGSSTSNYLWGVTFTADGRRGWAVGEDGTIIATEDGGTHWTPQTSSTSSRLLGVAFAADGRRGWAVGSRGTIVATKDGGGHWTPQISSTSVKDLQGVASAADGRQGWAVGEDGTIVATEDGGTHWIVHQRLAEVS